MNLKDIAAPAGDRVGVIWALDTSSDLNADLVRFGAGQGVEEHVKRVASESGWRVPYAT